MAPARGLCHPAGMKANRSYLRLAAALVTAFLAGGVIAAGTADKPRAVVYKSPWCGCCVQWVKHLESHGFDVETVDSEDMNSVKKELGLPVGLGSCHTAVVNDRYLIEGHVPAPDVLRLVESGADLKGLAVPGMPGGSPGMESAPAQPYDVIAFDAEGRQEVYAQYGNDSE